MTGISTCRGHANQPRSQGSLLPVPTERRVGERTWERGCILICIRGQILPETNNTEINLRETDHFDLDKRQLSKLRILL